MGRLFNFAQIERPGRASIKQQPQQDFRRNRLSNLRGIVRLDPAQIELGNPIDHKARQVFWGSGSSSLIVCFKVAT